MLRFVKSTSKKSGLAPGTLIHIGEKKVERPHLSLTDYDEAHLEEKPLADISEAFALRDTPTVSWINIDGVHDMQLIERIGKHFAIHPLTLEDIVNTAQRPKLEEFSGYLYLVFKMLAYDPDRRQVDSEQVSLVLGDSFLISFQEAAGDVFNPVRERIRNGRGRIRASGGDYLAYALVDAVVDHYFGVLESFGSQMEDLDEQLLSDPTPETLADIHALKRELIFLRRQIWPMRELLGGLLRGETMRIGEATLKYFNDVYDHAVQAIDTVESFRSLLAGMLDLYLATASNRMNEVMKMLTLIATIFIPVTFVAGIYGMNFEYMPELKHPWGYFAALGLMGTIAGALLLYFKRKSWL